MSRHERIEDFVCDHPVLAALGLVIISVLFLGLTIPTVADISRQMFGMTPGAARHVRHMSYTFEDYRVNPDSSVTFRDQFTNTWLTLPKDQVNVFPRQTWWWQRALPPRVK